MHSLQQVKALLVYHAWRAPVGCNNSILESNCVDISECTHIPTWRTPPPPPGSWKESPYRDPCHQICIFTQSNLELPIQCSYSWQSLLPGWVKEKCERVAQKQVQSASSSRSVVASTSSFNSFIFLFIICAIFQRVTMITVRMIMIIGWWLWLWSC